MTRWAATLLLLGCAPGEAPAPAGELRGSASAVERAPGPPAAPPGSAGARPPRGPVPPAARRIDPRAPDDWLPRAADGDVDLDGPALDALLRRAAETGSDALVVVRGGRVVVETAPRGPIETRSLTKSVAALAVIALVADGAIPSLDEPLSRWLPALRGEPGPTLRHLLTHSTGLAPGADIAALNAAEDRVAYAAALPRVGAPGARFRYSNEGAQLLSAVVAAAAGRPIDEYLRARVLRPIGVTSDAWTRDRAGNVMTYYGLALDARDLARVGLLLAGGGRFEGRSILPEHLVRELHAPSAVHPGFGLLFWLRVPLGLAPSAPAALAPLRGRTFADEEAFLREASPLLAAAERAALRQDLLRAGGPLAAAGAVRGFDAQGALGQYLAVYPADRLVVVRQHRNRRDPSSDARVTWRAFFDDVEALLPAR